MSVSGRYLLDTNIIIALFARDISVITNLTQAGEIFLPSIAIGELFYGAQKSGRVQANSARIYTLVVNSAVLFCDIETARVYGEVKDKLRRKGRPLPENDVWIAATALQHDLLLVTRDAHFQEVEGLQTVAW
jgi:tRNA(fMet)-specific endonuclease VapC